MYNYTLQATHHAKFDFDPTTWVVWANSQFATVSGVFLPSLLFCFLRLAYKSRRQMNRHRCFGPRMCILGVRIFNFHIFAYFSPKIVKISPKWAISSQNAETWNTRYFRNYETERRENLTQSWERKMRFSDAIWWRHNKYKMADGRHIENRFLAIYQRRIGRLMRNLDRK